MPQTLPSSLARLRSFARPRRAAFQRCELCAARLAGEHEHVVERATGRIACCCAACAMLFRNHATANFRTVPRDIAYLPDFRMTDAQWENLAIPINLAFLFESTAAGGLVAVYPSPAGGTQSQPMADAWRVIVEQNPLLTSFASDVEALLVNRMQGQRDHFRVPIDECYRLAGIVRSQWRGFTGGIALWRELASFFEALKARAQP